MRDYKHWKNNVNQFLREPSRIFCMLCEFYNNCQFITTKTHSRQKYFNYILPLFPSTNILKIPCNRGTVSPNWPDPYEKPCYYNGVKDKHKFFYHRGNCSISQKLTKSLPPDSLTLFLTLIPPPLIKRLSRWHKSLSRPYFYLKWDSKVKKRPLKF